MAPIRKPRFALTPREKILVVLFAITLPLVNPWVRGDGVGYYAYGRALLIEGRLDFTQDWLHANSSYRSGRLDKDGKILDSQFTRTRHLDNHFTIGPAILWFPFLLTAHILVKASQILGAHITADGFSLPYLAAMAIGTAFYGFLGLWISFQLAKKYFSENFAFAATLGIWFASSLPVYLYFNPSWSHAHSAFIVALFVWYWERTLETRTLLQWIVLGLIVGLMIDIYYPNGVFLLLPLLESIRSYWQIFRRPAQVELDARRIFVADLLFGFAAILAFLPTLICHWIIYGNPFASGYYSVEIWNWSAPALLSVLFSSAHGLFSWTPILGAAAFGLFIFGRKKHWPGASLVLVLLAFYYLIASFPDWQGISSFGNRFFVSLTPLFVLGLAAFFDWVAGKWQKRRAAIFIGTITSLFIVWNMGLIFQWGTHLIPARGPISWREAAYNQVAVVPEQAAKTMKAYLTTRQRLMGRIEQKDLQELKEQNEKQ